ncbi:biotin--[acetyl-CoA-carboxylase] ligase [Thiomicrospira microaerophila]|uniref:biotin--[acetyl-CoA-carboxylase] ligase n=1 Tax=Thiomicrospira microaerophila TaxID=406020 RepID=UPI002010919A|nr:biotin--[acetyl-CoA-carboxylase] ligase [Thiomicrospira microaerophila]UQB42315.1 biotin--[acetyl-CoA-carboxylase] ligase [Thiomicrospira microaerophila]
MNYDLINLETVDSTNAFLKQHLKVNKVYRPLVCVTQRQTAGYGQRQRAWLTNAQSCIFSIAYPLVQGDPIAPSLSLKLAISLHRSLTQLVPESLWLKWPNDLYDLQGKVAGILIEVAKTSEAQSCLIIGIGINRHALLSAQRQVGASALSYFDTEDLLALLMQNLSSLVMQQHDYDYWALHDYLSLGEAVSLISHDNATIQKQGLYQGIDNDGSAKIDTGQSELMRLSSGWSIRKRSEKAKSLSG